MLKTYEVLEKRITEVLRQNGELEEKEGIGYILLGYIKSKVYININIVLDFAREYQCSVDYLLGLSDCYDVM